MGVNLKKQQQQQQQKSSKNTDQTHEKMLQRLPNALAQVKAENTSENFLSKIDQLMYFLYQPKEIAEKLYSNIMIFIEL